MSAAVMWYCVDAARERHGPMPAEAIRERFAQGLLHRRSLVWCEGMPQWQPLEAVAEALGVDLTVATPPTLPPPLANAASPPPMTSDTAAPPPAAATVESSAAPGHASASPTSPDANAREDGLQAAYAASARDASAGEGAIDHEDVVDAGFARRLAAYLIDALILVLAYYALLIVFGIVIGVGALGVSSLTVDLPDAGDGSSHVWVILFAVLLYGLPFILQGAYHILFTRSAWQATPGKRAVGIKVVDLEGRRLSGGRSTGRWFAAALSYLTLYLGFLMAAFTDRKQALHDVVASTRVVDQWAYTANPERQQRGMGGCAVAALILGALVAALFVIGILAAIALPAYQDYTQRAKVAAVMSEGRAMTAAVDRFVDNTDRCPTGLSEAGLEAPTTPLIPRAGLGELPDGRCTVELRLAGDGTAATAALQGEFLWFIREDNARWRCEGSMATADRPRGCDG